MFLYIRICYYEFEPIAKKADKTFLTGSKCMEMVQKALILTPGGVNIGILSGAYRNIRAIEKMGGVSGSDLVLDSVDSMNLKCRSHKFLVKHEKITDLMMAVIAEVPLTAFGKGGQRVWKGGSGRISKMWNSDTNWATISHTTNSVYFDGESLPMYNANLTGTEGGQNLLVRWYSKEAPGKNEVVFLQLKAYQEAWVGPKSYKRKVAILQRDMNQFVKLDGIMWSQDLAKEIVLRARPTLTEDKLDTAVNMLLECRQCLITKQLSPCVRTTFSRITFQSLPVGPQAASSDRKSVV